MKLFVKNLTHVDLSYFCPERGVLGESWQTDVILTGKLNAEGMVCDFSIVKKQIKKWLDDHIDHTLVIPAEHPHVSIVQLESARTQFVFDDGNPAHRLECNAPTQAFCALPLTQISAAAAAHWVEQQILNLLPAELEAVAVRFTPEQTNAAQYQYSHGLKKHDGNCQRIVHGHRSVIEVYRNGTRDEALEQDWAQRWHDIYLGTDEDLLGIIEESSQRYHHFAYDGSQGFYELKIPSRQVYMLPCDTTVENLATYIANKLAHENQGDVIEVHAFEGIGKGAICSAQV
ncbi:hypothetical protein FJM67_15965 [Maribrevibacterium harenarium]|uniref:6-carboxy-5,6,7,8-tetrahydropterin synthase n=1 Tax=Maribrevibacterium harenarium TaxID=2589817 RepID=A0A501WHK8_9GAMM|nr:6-carboxytetrahydropterin synthase [Maribrevibacterium harenarium]TPE46571.1 hypothetical protein FJM67_15965 [Maribrevibacterium harenarium]